MLPIGKREIFDQFPPVICRKNISLEESGPTTTKIAKSLGIKGLKKEKNVSDVFHAKTFSCLLPWCNAYAIAALD